jgi:hypothetical protein
VPIISKPRAHEKQQQQQQHPAERKEGKKRRKKREQGRKNPLVLLWMTNKHPQHPIPPFLFFFLFDFI